MSGARPEEFGPYLVYEQLGSGGMAEVHRAELAGIEGFSRQIALKRMFAHLADNDDMLEAFVREARLASFMRHRNLAQTYELGKVGDIYFIAMELITGRTLRDLLNHCGATTGRIPVPVALNILNQLCDALDYAHNLCDESGQPLGIIHRDVSPSNVIVAEGGVVKLIDFGIAKASAIGMQTTGGMIKGKFGYMAPEYIAGSIDARADLFAVGVIAHELLTNRPLFSGSDEVQTLQRVTKMVVMPPSHYNPQVPPEIDDVVMTALERDPERRWQHATALRTAMTTLTRRLGLEVQDSHVTEWIAWAFAQTKPRGLRTQTPGRGRAAASLSSELTLPPTEPGAHQSFTTLLDEPSVEMQLIVAPDGTPSDVVPPRWTADPADDESETIAQGVAYDDQVATRARSESARTPWTERPSAPIGRTLLGASGQRAAANSRDASGSHPGIPRASSPQPQPLHPGPAAGPGLRAGPAVPRVKPSGTSMAQERASKRGVLVGVVFVLLAGAAAAVASLAMHS